MAKAKPTNETKVRAEAALEVAEKAAVIEKLTTDVSQSGEALISLMLKTMEPEDEDFEALRELSKTPQMTDALYKLAQAYKLIRLYGE